MKKTVLFIFSFLFLASLTFGDDVWNLDFESSGGYTTTPSNITQEYSDYFGRFQETEISATFTNDQGIYFFAAQDIDGLFYDGSQPVTLPVYFDVDDISISGYTGLSFSVFLAEDDDGTNQDWDAADYFHIGYDIDNTGTFTPLLWVESSGDSNAEPAIDTNFDGTGDGTFITDDFAQFTVSIPGTGSLLDLQIEFSLNSGDEDIALDNLLITGTPTGGVSDPTSFTATTYATDQINLVWLQNGNNDDVMVAWTSDGVFGAPVDGTSYSATDVITGGGTILYNGSNLLYNHTSLDSDTQYFYKAWSVDGTTNYSSGVTDNATTYKDEPTNHVTGFTAVADGFSKIDLSWIENDGSVVPDGYLIKASTADNISNPVDAIAITDNSTIGNDSGAINLAHGTTAYEWTGLDPETIYYFKIFPYTNSGLAIDYKTDGTVPSANATTGAMPAISELLISEVADPSDNWEARFVELYNASGSTIVFDSRAVWNLARQSNGGSWDDILLTGSIAAGATYIIAYSQTVFEATYGMSADLYNNNINGNGNDGYFIYYGGDHSTGILSDAYGEIDVDGTGELWEYLDSHAERNAGVTEPSATWIASEYTIPASATAAECTPGDSPLPVTLTDFSTAIIMNEFVQISWTTQSESSINVWNLYRGTDDSMGQILINSQPGTNTSQPNTYIFDDFEVEENITYYYYLEVTEYDGTSNMWGPISAMLEGSSMPELPTISMLNSNYPNPFNPSTTIKCDIKEGEEGVLTIYNFRGQLIEKQILNAGEHTFEWDGTAYGSGVYLYKLETDSYTETKKMIMLK